MTDRPGFGPSIELTKLWQKTSAKGLVYFVGRLSGARLTILPNRNKTADTDHDYVVLLSQAEPYQPKPQTADPAPVLPFEPRKPAPAPVPPQPDDRPAAKYPAQRPDDRLKKRAVGGGRTQLVVPRRCLSAGAGQLGLRPVSVVRIVQCRSEVATYFALDSSRSGNAHTVSDEQLYHCVRCGKDLALSQFPADSAECADCVRRVAIVDAWVTALWRERQQHKEQKPE